MVATKKPAGMSGPRGGEKLEIRVPEFGRLVDAAIGKLPGMSNPKAAKLVGVSPEMIRRYRRGFAMAEGDKLRKLSKLTGIDIQTLLMADKGGTKGKAVESRRKLDPREAEMLEEYRQLPPDVQTVARARIIELLEEFGPASKKNPFGKGSGTQ